MKKTVWIVASVTVFALACSDNNAAKTAQQSGANNKATAQGNITVAGCLARADETPGSIGTSGNAPAANPPAGTSAATPAPATERPSSLGFPPLLAVVLAALPARLG